MRSLWKKSFLTAALQLAHSAHTTTWHMHCVQFTVKFLPLHLYSKFIWLMSIGDSPARLPMLTWKVEVHVTLPVCCGKTRVQDGHIRNGCCRVVGGSFGLPLLSWGRWSAVRSCWSTSPHNALCCRSRTVCRVSRHSTTFGNSLPFLKTERHSRFVTVDRDVRPTSNASPLHWYKRIVKFMQDFC